MSVETPAEIATERSRLERACAGDEQAFAELTAPYTRELHLHCYRLLGSLVDADDLVQETLLAAWHGLGGFASRSSLRAWLYRIATNRCLNALRNARRRPEPPVPPFDPPEPSGWTEVPWLQPYPDVWLEQAAAEPAARWIARETVELAFVAALQWLPPRQAAALVLHDVLGFSVAEVGAMLETTPAAAKGLVQRARATLDLRRAGAAPQPGSPEERDLAARFAQAFASDDVDGVVALLTDDAWLAMPPAPHEYHGREAIASFLRASAAWRAGRHLELVPTRANRQPAFGCYLASFDGRAPEPTGLLVLTLSGSRIRKITRFLDPDLARMAPVALDARANGADDLSA